MASKVPDAALARTGNSMARACVSEALAESGQPKKAFAADIGIGEPELSKALSGNTATRFAIAWLDELPPNVTLAVLEKYAQRRFGARLLLPEPQDLLAHVLRQVEGLTEQVRQAEMARVLRLRGVA